MTPLEAIAETAKRTPEKIACRFADASLTYEKLWRETERCADLLRRQGTSPVLLFGGREMWMLVSMLACLRCGRAYVPLSPQTPPVRLSSVAAQTKATLLLGDKPPRLDGVDCRSFASLEAFADCPAQETNDMTAYIIFTSGSTGQPKGVPISHANLQSFIDWICALPPLNQWKDLRVLGQANFSFDLSVADTFFSLCAGHTLVNFDAMTQPVYPDFLLLLSAVDVAVLTPTMLRLCLADKQFCRAQMPRLRCVYLCGEVFEAALARRLFQAFPDLYVLNAYGPTEAASAVCAAHITPKTAAAAALLPVGEGDAFATEVAVEGGEIILRGKSVFGGYLGAPDPSLPVTGYHTGDRGFWGKGQLFCKGRVDRQIKYKGYRIEMDDLEENLSALPGVRDSAVVAKRDAEGNVRLLKAFVEMDAPAFARTDLKALLAQRLPQYMLPKVISRVDALPINENGKINRKELETWN